MIPDMSEFRPGASFPGGVAIFTPAGGEVRGKTKSNSQNNSNLKFT
jgi:hypothetical protein